MCFLRFNVSLPWGENEAVVSCSLALHAGCECCCAYVVILPLRLQNPSSARVSVGIFYCVWRCWLRLEGA